MPKSCEHSPLTKVENVRLDKLSSKQEVFPSCLIHDEESCFLINISVGHPFRVCQSTSAPSSPLKEYNVFSPIDQPFQAERLLMKFQQQYRLMQNFQEFNFQLV